MKVTKKTKVAASAPASTPASKLSPEELAAAKRLCLIDVDAEGNFVSAVNGLNEPITGARLEQAKAAAEKEKQSHADECEAEKVKAQAQANARGVAVDGVAPVKKVKAPRANGGASVASVARDLVVAGKTNEEIFAVLAKDFNLPESKRSYPAWYRNSCVKKGLITKEFAKAHAGAGGAGMPAEVKAKLKAKAEAKKAAAPKKEDVKATKAMAAAMVKKPLTKKARRLAAKTRPAKSK